MTAEDRRDLIEDVSVTLYGLLLRSQNADAHALFEAWINSSHEIVTKYPDDWRTRVLYAATENERPLRAICNNVWRFDREGVVPAKWTQEG